MENKTFSMILLTMVLISSILFGCGYCFSASTLCRRVGFKIRDKHVTSSFTAPSVVRCVTLCEETTECISASWGTVDHTCRLSITGTWNVGYGRIEAAPAFNTYSKMEWRVWHVEGPKGRYTLTFNEAEAECSKTNGRLATVAELLEERSLGFERCSCGWLANRSIGFVMQTNVQNCYGYFTTGIHYCTLNKANAYCVFNF